MSKRNGKPVHAEAKATIRCAVYTRKSTEEGLEQAFNTLDAQRDACEAYIASQRAEGWVLVHVLMSSPDAARRRVIPALLMAYRASEDGWVPMDAILIGLDTAALDADWRAWVADQHVDDPLAELARLFGQALRTTDLVAPDWIKECYSWERRHVLPVPPVPEKPR